LRDHAKRQEQITIKIKRARIISSIDIHTFLLYSATFTLLSHSRFLVSTFNLRRIKMKLPAYRRRTGQPCGKLHFSVLRLRKGSRPSDDLSAKDAEEANRRGRRRVIRFADFPTDQQACPRFAIRP
jgi:hypothetical protein